MALFQYSISRIHLPVLGERLTKSFFMGLPTGLYLASGVGHAPGQPCFAETVAPVEGRNAQ